MYKIAKWCLSLGYEWIVFYPVRKISGYAGEFFTKDKFKEKKRMPLPYKFKTYSFGTSSF